MTILAFLALDDLYVAWWLAEFFVDPRSSERGKDSHG
jgi:hypothetical protein